ncbi:hypothetical protein PINS_up017260 [Pythium insidiosum]|nr:hypothetical protein PINS_up017260 [Pythium insidiosum]
MEQQPLFQQQMLATQVQLRTPPKKRGNPPTFNGEVSEDQELYLFSTEQYYSDFKEEMERNTSDFVDTVFANLGPIVQAWFREFKLSLGPDVPISWSLFKQRLRERFRDSDFQQKLLTKLFELRFQTTQQEYPDIASECVPPVHARAHMPQGPRNTDAPSTQPHPTAQPRRTDATLR